MKKLLLTTTVLVTAFCMQAAIAENRAFPTKKIDNAPAKDVSSYGAPSLGFSGVFDQQMGFRLQDNKYIKKADIGTPFTVRKIGVSKFNPNMGFDTRAALNVTAKGKTSSGLNYGANIGIYNLIGFPKDNKAALKSKNFLYMDDDNMGRLEIGGKEGASETMLSTAENVAAATGGVAGSWYKYVNLNTYNPTATATVTAFRTQAVNSADFYMGTGSLLDNGTAESSAVQKARKLTYYTPKIKDTGIQFGISYIPDSKNYPSIVTGEFAGYPNTSTIDPAKDKGFKDGFMAGLTWENKLDKDNTIKMDLVGEHGSLPKDLKTVYYKVQTVGGSLSHTWKDLSGVISYNYFGKSGLVKTGSAAPATAPKIKKDNYIATLGFGYNIDSKTRVSLTGLMSEKWKNKFRNISLGMDYKLAPGLIPYAEVSCFEMKQKFKDTSVANVAGNARQASANVYKNKGTSFILGTKVKF